MPYNGGQRIKLLTLWQARGNCPVKKQLEFVNQVNENIIALRASVSAGEQNDRFVFFDYYIPVEGGISKKAVVLATKHFLEVQKLVITDSQYAAHEVLS
jgi:hypothetical protein